MTQPQRIQRRRTPGWRMPEGAVYVGRPTKWGNPFLLGDVYRAYPSLTDEQSHGMVVAQFRDLLRADGPITLSVLKGAGWRESVTYRYPVREAIVRELRGRDLACWCPLSSPCHADVLLEVANR